MFTKIDSSVVYVCRGNATELSTDNSYKRIVTFAFASAKVLLFFDMSKFWADFCSNKIIFCPLCVDYIGFTDQ